jgi:hypothetical protein
MILHRHLRSLMSSTSATLLVGLVCALLHVVVAMRLLLAQALEVPRNSAIGSRSQLSLIDNLQKPGTAGSIKVRD